IQRVSRELADLVNNISEASRNQARSSTELTGAMEVIRKVTSVTSSGITETRDFMIKLGELTDRLKMTVAGFSLNKKEKWSRFKKQNVTPLEQKKPALEIDTSTGQGGSGDGYGNKIV